MTSVRIVGVMSILLSPLSLSLLRSGAGRAPLRMWEPDETEEEIRFSTRLLEDAVTRWGGGASDGLARASLRAERKVEAIEAWIRILSVDMQI